MKPVVRRDLGSFLSDAPPARTRMRPQYTRASRTVAGHSERVRQFLKAACDAGDPTRWFSNAEIAAALNLTMGEVNGATNSLMQRGEVERLLPPHLARRKAGQAFRWMR